MTIDLDAIRARLAATTSNGWFASDVFDAGKPTGWGVVTADNDMIIGARLLRADAEFIAHAPTDIAALLAHVAELEAERASEATEADRLNVITGEQGERIAYLERAILTAREQGARLATLARAYLAAEDALGTHDTDEGHLAAVREVERIDVELRGALDPAAIAKGGKP